MIIRTITAMAFAFASFAAAQGIDTMEKKDVKAADLGQTYRISADSVNALKAAYKTGYGGIGIALAISQKTGLSVEEVLRMKKEDKMGWGAIEKKLDVKTDKALEKQEKKEIKMEQKMEKKQAKEEKKLEKAQEGK
jgi:hypothetical protein